MINRYYFIDENLKIGFKISLEGHNINHTNFLLNDIPNFPLTSNLNQNIKIKFKKQRNLDGFLTKLTQ